MPLQLTDAQCIHSFSILYLLLVVMNLIWVKVKADFGYTQCLTGKGTENKQVKDHV